METLGFAISFVTCQSGDIFEYIHVEGCLLKALTLRAQRKADPPSSLRHWQLVLKYFRY